MYERRAGEVKVLLAHPGGPFFRNKDEGAWTLPKGLAETDETLQATARREFREEVGLDAHAPLLALGFVRQKGGKDVHAWAFEGTFPEEHVLNCNTFAMEWPPRSGRLQTFPEVDRAQMFTLPEARLKMNAAQTEFLDRLEALLAADAGNKGAGP